MGKIYNENELKYILEIVANKAAIEKYRDQLFILGLSSESVRNIIMNPIDDLFLEFSLKYISLVKTIDSNLEKIIYLNNFDLFNSRGYQFLDYGSRLMCECFKNSAATNAESTTCGIVDLTTEFEYNAQYAVNEIKHVEKEKYLQTCFEVNLIYIACFEEVFNKIHNEIFLKAIGNKTLMSIANPYVVTSSMIGDLIKNLFYLKDDAKIGSSNKENYNYKITHNSLNNAITYMEQFENYIKSLLVDSRGR